MRSYDTDSFCIASIPHSSSSNSLDPHRGAPGTGPPNSRWHEFKSSTLLSPSLSGDKDSVASCFHTTASGKFFSSGHGLGMPHACVLCARFTSSVSVSVATHIWLPAVLSNNEHRTNSIGSARLERVDVETNPAGTSFGMVHQMMCAAD